MQPPMIQIPMQRPAMALACGGMFRFGQNPFRGNKAPEQKTSSSSSRDPAPKPLLMLMPPPAEKKKPEGPPSASADSPCFEKPPLDGLSENGYVIQDLLVWLRAAITHSDLTAHFVAGSLLRSGYTRAVLQILALSAIEDVGPANGRALYAYHLNLRKITCGLDKILGRSPDEADIDRLCLHRDLVAVYVRMVDDAIFAPKSRVLLSISAYSALVTEQSRSKMSSALEHEQGIRALHNQLRAAIAPGNRNMNFFCQTVNMCDQLRAHFDRIEPMSLKGDIARSAVSKAMWDVLESASVSYAYPDQRLLHLQLRKMVNTDSWCDQRMRFIFACYIVFNPSCVCWDIKEYKNSSPERLQDAVAMCSKRMGRWVQMPSYAIDPSIPATEMIRYRNPERFNQEMERRGEAQLFADVKIGVSHPEVVTNDKERITTYWLTTRHPCRQNYLAEYFFLSGDWEETLIEQRVSSLDAMISAQSESLVLPFLHARYLRLPGMMFNERVPTAQEVAAQIAPHHPPPPPPPQKEEAEEDAKIEVVPQLFESPHFFQQSQPYHEGWNAYGSPEPQRHPPTPTPGYYQEADDQEAEAEAEAEDADLSDHSRHILNMRRVTRRDRLRYGYEDGEEYDDNDDETNDPDYDDRYDQGD